MKVNYYEVLGVERSASEDEIRDRFRKLARENHPDRYQGPDKADAERHFQTLTEAVNVLTNPARRKQHDSEISAGGKAAAADFSQVAKAVPGWADWLLPARRLSVKPCDSKAPTSTAPTRPKPRWSVAGMPRPEVPASRAGLPGSSGMVWVGPP